MNDTKLDNIKTKHIYGNGSVQVDVSIVIPTYKRIDLLRKCLKSIIAQNKVSNLSIEVVVCSNDCNFQINDLGIWLDPAIFNIYVNEKNVGMCENMNRCFQNANGKYIAYVQDDDVLLPNYLEEIKKIIVSDDIEKFDCIIPNRYYYMPDSALTTQFGKKAIRNMYIKNYICRFFQIGKAIPKFQKINPYDTMITMYPFYSGGPTCGILFKKECLYNFGGFDIRYPYGFDYSFFMNFSEKYNVGLYNEYLSIYMTSDSASNRPEVQFDFFKARYDYIQKNHQKYNISNRRKEVIVYCTYSGYPLETQKMIENEMPLTYVSKIVCIFYNLWARMKVYKSGGYRRKSCSRQLQKWYKEL